jgi:hypothetical protein
VAEGCGAWVGGSGERVGWRGVAEERAVETGNGEGDARAAVVGEAATVDDAMQPTRATAAQETNADWIMVGVMMSLSARDGSTLEARR